MAEPTEGRDPESQVDVQPGGRSSRGPNPSPGGVEEPAGLVPPYDDRTSGPETSSGRARAESVERQLADADPGSHGATTSPSDEQPVRDDEVGGGAPPSPKGVGRSTSRRGEDVEDDDGQEAGRHRAGTSGAQRPAGRSDARDSTGVDPEEARGGATTQPSGDQGG